MPMSFSGNIIFIILSLFLSYNLLRPMVSRKIFDSQFLIVALTSFCYVILLQCAVLISWLIDSNAKLTSVPGLLFAMLLSVYLCKNYICKRKSVYASEKSIKLFNPSDLSAVIVATIISAIIILPPLFICNDSQRSAVFLIANSSNSSDDAAHLGFLNDNIQFNSANILSSRSVDKTRNDSFYPVSFSSVNSIIIKSVSPKIQSGTQTLFAYVIMKLFWMFTLCYLITRIAFVTYQFLGSEIIKKRIAIAISVISLFFCYLFVIPLSQEGAFSFLPQLISLVLLLPLLMQFGTEKSSRSLQLIILVGIGGCLSWILPLPAMALAILAMLAYKVADTKLSTELSSIVAIIRKSALMIIFVYGAVITQFLIMISTNNSVSTSFIKGLLIDGGRITESSFYGMFFCIGAVASFMVLTSEKIKKLYPTLFIVISLTAYCCFVFLIQNALANKNTYYYYKLLDTLLCFVAPICIAGFGLIIKKISDNWDKMGIIILGILTILVFLQTISTSDGYGIYYATGYRPLSAKISQVVVDELSNRMSIKNYYEPEYSIIYTAPNNKIENKHATKLIKSNKPSSDCYNDLEGTIYSSTSIYTVLDIISTSCKGYNINILTNKASYSAFLSAINDEKLYATVKVEVKF